MTDVFKDKSVMPPDAGVRRERPMLNSALPASGPDGVVRTAQTLSERNSYGYREDLMDVRNLHRPRFGYGT